MVKYTYAYVYIYKIRCSNVALVRLVLLSVSMRCGTSFTRMHGALPEQSLTQKEVESKRNILAYTSAALLTWGTLRINCQMSF